MQNFSKVAQKSHSLKLTDNAIHSLKSDSTTRITYTFKNTETLDQKYLKGLKLRFNPSTNLKIFSVDFRFKNKSGPRRAGSRTYSICHPCAYARPRGRW